MLAGPSSKRESAPEPLSLSHRYRNAKEPVLTDGLLLDLSGYPEDTLLNGSDSFDVDGFWALPTLADLELHLLTINQGTTTGADDV